MCKLEGPDKMHLEAAEGWLGLGAYGEAFDEVELIALELHEHPDVLAVRVLIHKAMRNWEHVAVMARALTEMRPGSPVGWIHHADALHELTFTEEAFQKLLPVAARFPKLWTIPYNLSRYCAQLGRFEEAKQWFQKAMAIDEKQVQRVALDDPDLQPLWDSMSTTIWKRI
jgi:tetratricopeptide (TPR) repeat protein